MKDSVLIKSFPKGIVLQLSSEVDFQDIVSEVAAKFAEARNFFGKSTMALSLEGRNLTQEEENSILAAIKENSDLKICCIVGKEEKTSEFFAKAVEKMEKQIKAMEDGQIYKCSLKNNEILEVDNSVIIIGDVAEGCAVFSPENIIVLGALQGEAYAGGNGNKDAFVAALEMEPERLKIGDFKYKAIQKKSLWGKKEKEKHPKVAKIIDGKIEMMELTKDLLSNF